MHQPWEEDTSVTRWRPVIDLVFYDPGVLGCESRPELWRCWRTCFAFAIPAGDPAGWRPCGKNSIFGEAFWRKTRHSLKAPFLRFLAYPEQSVQCCIGVEGNIVALKQPEASGAGVPSLVQAGQRNLTHQSSESADSQSDRVLWQQRQLYPSRPLWS